MPERPSKIGKLGTGRARLAKYAPGVRLVGVEQDAVVFEVGSGDYKFVVGDGLFTAPEGYDGDDEGDRDAD